MFIKKKKLYTVYKELFIYENSVLSVSTHQSFNTLDTVTVLYLYFSVIGSTKKQKKFIKYVNAHTKNQIFFIKKSDKNTFELIIVMHFQQKWIKFQIRKITINDRDNIIYK